MNGDSGISVHYFRGLIAETQIQMEDLCSSWEKKLSIGDNFDENMCGQIRTVVGQARILTNERGRLTQFKSLVDNCEFGRGEKETTLLDLQGFWEMVHVQISGIRDKFQYLESIERGELFIDEEELSSSKTVVTAVNKIPSRRPKLTKAVSSRDLKAFKAARKREMSQSNSQSCILDIPRKEGGRTAVAPFRSFQGGFFNIKSPLRPSSPPGSPKHQRRQRFDSTRSNEYLRQAVLSTSVKTNPASPFMVMKVSSIGKKDLGVSDVKQRLFVD